MTKEQQQVKEFMQCAGQECPEKPEYFYSTKESIPFRTKLILEELGEYVDASSIDQIADALGDLLYVVLGAAVAHGIDLEPVFQEIHRSNISKFIDGYKREDGKWMKGPSYSPANLEPILKQQMQ